MTWVRRAGLAAACAAGFWLLAWLAASALIVRAPLTDADAIVVLAGPNAAIERSQHAATLYQNGVAPLVLLTDDRQRAGWSSREQRNPYFIEQSIAELRTAGVPEGSLIVLPDRVSSTHDEALALRRYSRENHVHRLLIVTSAYHSRRAGGGTWRSST